MRRVLVLLAVVAVAFAACDPVHSRKVASLGDEAPGGGPGPTHRPGQPCLECHDGSIGPDFSVAGTIFESADSPLPAVGATVILQSSDGSPPHEKSTNSAGNFYMTAGEYQPVYPMKVSVRFGPTTVKMASTIGRA
ncbi:MAG: hypothetical protein ABIP39_14490, partial [Polyangiaceae bacterium]